MNNPLLYLALIVWAISSVGLIIFVLLHSGKGSGLSEMLGGAMSPASAGTSIIEKNLDRITVGFAIAFGVSLHRADDRLPARHLAGRRTFTVRSAGSSQARAVLASHPRIRPPRKLAGVRTHPASLPSEA